MATAVSDRETPAEALARIQSGFSKNDELVICAFAEAGVDPDEIEPRENVLTFNAWRAKGRKVAKGATSVRVQTWIPCRDKDGDDGAREGEVSTRRRKMRPKIAFLFHMSQTIAVDAPEGTRPAAWRNPILVKAGTYAMLEEGGDA
jgi:hypothetical protein